MTRSFKILVGLSAASLAVIVFFQNCAQSPQANYGVTKSSSTANDLNSSSDPADSSNTNTNIQSTKLLPQVNIITSPANQVDCSNSGAFIQKEVLNADLNMTACIEYSLDMPAGNPRFGEKNLCDTVEKFRAIGGSWVYDSNSKKLFTPKTYLSTQSIVVPGTYVHVIRDSQGNIYKSLPYVVKRPGATNCLAAGVVQGTSCGWRTNQTLFSPVPQPPADSCSTSNAGQVVNKNSIDYTCLCQ